MYCRPGTTIEGVSTQPLQALLESAFPDATVASPRFSGLSLLEQHRLVNEALSEPLRDGTIHELRIKTKGSE